MTSGCLGEKTPVELQPVQPAVFVEYERSGGYEGLDERLVIFDNGAAIISGGKGSREIALNETELSHISDLLDAAGFLSLERSYSARPGAADVFRYTVTYSGHIVSAEDTAVPAVLRPLIEELNRILLSGGHGGTDMPSFLISPPG